MGQLPIGLEHQRLHVEPCHQFITPAQLPAASSSGIQNRQRPAATRGESEESRDRGRGTSSDACVDHTHRAQRVLQPCLRDGITGGATAITRARAGVAPQHAFARRDRHHSADRHRGSPIRGGGTRRSGHRRAGQHREHRGHAPSSRIRSRIAGLLEHADRADGAAGVSTDACGRGCGREKRARTADRSPANAAVTGSDGCEHSLLPQSDVAGCQRERELRPPGNRRQRANKV